MKQLQVYFQQRPQHRKRQRETVEFCPKQIIAITPKGLSFIKDTSLVKKKTSWKGKWKAKILRALVPINIRPVVDPNAHQADIIYTWGSFPINIKKPYVVEIDTPYVLCLYSLIWFAIMRPILRYLLTRSNCRNIVCISEASKQTLKSELGDKVSRKAQVVYPYMENFSARRSFSRSNKVNFLFVSTQFYLKGGRETLLSFEKLVESYPSAHLTIVSNTPKEILEQYGNVDWVTFVAANLDKDELFKKYYEHADVFVLPTYQDSFGLVYLEALSFGLPIIATRTYAVPEIVEEGKNGFLIEPPFPYYMKNGKASKKNWNKDLSIRIRRECYPEVERELYSNMVKMMDKDIRETMSQHAVTLFKNKFDNEIRSKNFIKVIFGDIV